METTPRPHHAERGRTVAPPGVVVRGDFTDRKIGAERHGEGENCTTRGRVATDIIVSLCEICHVNMKKLTPMGIELHPPGKFVERGTTCR